MKMFARSPRKDSRQMDFFELMSSAAVSHAKTSVMQGESPASMATEAVFGLNTHDSLETLDPSTPSLKTHTPCVDADLTGSSKVLPASGMMLNGQLLPRAPWVSHTCESDCTLWPTPRANGGNNAGGSNSRKAAIKRGTYITGNVNPNHREWLMGFPIGWSEITHSETQ